MRSLFVAFILLATIGSSGVRAEAAFWNSTARSSVSQTYRRTAANGRTVYYRRIDTQPNMLERLWELEQRKNRWLLKNVLRR